MNYSVTTIRLKGKTVFRVKDVSMDSLVVSKAVKKGNKMFIASIRVTTIK